MASYICFFCFVLPLLASPLSAAQTVENLSSHPLTAAWADLGKAKDWGLPTDTAGVRLLGEDGISWPAEVRDGRLLGAVTLAGGESALLRAEPDAADNLDLSVADDGQSATMSNGLVRWSVAPAAHGAPRWQLSLGASTTPKDSEIVIEEMRYRGFLDSEPRGRLRRHEYMELGAVDVESLPIREITTSRTESTVTTLVFRAAPAEFPGLDFMEEYTLTAGSPMVAYRMRPANRGSSPIFLAYVFWEGDLHGEYGPGLTGAKLLSAPYARQPLRLVTSRNAIELTRWGRGWGSERAWVGYQSQGPSGLGLAVTTPEILTANHYYGASIWVARMQGIHFDLTETARGYYPVELRVGDGRAELGLDLIITQGAVPPGPVARQWLLLAGDPDRAEALIDNLTAQLPVAVTSQADRRALRPVPAMAAVTGLADSQGWGISPPVDEGPSFLLGRETAATATAGISALSTPRRLSANVAMAHSPVTVRFSALSESGENLIGQATSGGTFEWVLDPGAQAVFAQPWVLKIATTEGTGTAVIERLAFGEPRPAAPELQSPLPDQNITDIATFFRWVAVPGAIAYDLKYGPADGSLSPRRERIDFLGNLPHFMPIELPKPGRHMWRVRSLLPDGTNGPWSDAREFTVNSEHTMAGLIRPITPRNPLFAMEVHGATDLVPFTRVIPEDLRPYTAVLSSHTKYFEEIGRTLFDFFKEPGEGVEDPVSLLIRFGGHGNMNDVYVSLSELEAIFQEIPWVIGVIGGESFEQLYSTNPYTRRLIQLCGKYGRWYMEGDGNYEVNKLHRMASAPETANLIRRYAPYMVFSQKNNIHYLQHVTQSSIMGMKLSGMIGQMGSWEDSGWYWEQVGFRGLGERFGIRSGDIARTPAVFWALTWVHGLSQGATVFHVDGQVATFKGSGHGDQQAADFKAMKHQVWDTEGTILEAYERVIAPIFRAIVNENLIPDEDDVLESLQLAVREDRPWEPEDYSDGAFYAQYTPLFQETYGFFNDPGSEGYEYFPNTSRFGYFPILPLGAPPLTRPDGTRIPEVAMSELTSREAVRRAFHDSYPEVDYGDALVVRFPDRFFAQNTHENRDIAQQARIPIGAEGIERIEATIEPHMYLVGRWNRPENGLWLQTNCEYYERPIRLAVISESRPVVEVTPPSALKRQTWRNGRLELELTSTEGAVNILVTKHL